MHDHSRSTGAQPNERRTAGRLLRWIPGLLVFAALFAGPALVQAGPSDETLQEGAAVYQSVCSSCHQPGGAGLEGQFPPLVDNPNVDDAAYVEQVIREGLTGPITVNGVEYDGTMPPQSTLSDTDVDAVVAYVQSGFASPAVEGGSAETTGATSGAELPGLASWTIRIAMLIGIIGGLFVLGPRIFGVSDRRTMSWLDSWLKTAVIVVGLILAVVIIPARALELQVVRDLPREMQDLIAVSLWGGGLIAGIWVLWYAHRENRI